MDRGPLTDSPLAEGARRVLWHAQHPVHVDAWQPSIGRLIVRKRALCEMENVRTRPRNLITRNLTQSEVTRTLADDQVMGLSRSGVLQRQDRPVTRRSAVTQLVHLLACLRQRHRFLICISNERNRVIVIFIETQRARIAISAK